MMRGYGVLEALGTELWGRAVGVGVGGDAAVAGDVLEKLTIK